jgi:glutathione S-transferase
MTPGGMLMGLRLYMSWLSPFSRKVALGLELKGLAYEAVDGLKREFRTELKRANPRAEVPVLFDDDLVVVNSSDIVQYLEWRYPSPALYPESIPERVAARALERLHDHRFDPICVDCSYWHWAERDDVAPPGLLEAGQRDIDATLQQVEQALVSRPKPWPFGSPGVVECAWYPNLDVVRPLGFTIDAARFPAVLGWLETMRSHPVFANDRRRTEQFLEVVPTSNHERRKLFYSGDRMEWLFSRGFHDWFHHEIQAGRAAFPD